MILNCASMLVINNRLDLKLKDLPAREPPNLSDLTPKMAPKAKTASKAKAVAKRPAGNVGGTALVAPAPAPAAPLLALPAPAPAAALLALPAPLAPTAGPLLAAAPPATPPAATPPATTPAAPAQPAIAASAVAQQLPVAVKIEPTEPGTISGGRPSSGVSRQAQQSWQNFKSSKAGKTQLQGLEGPQLEDFRKKWLVDKQAALNTIVEKSAQSVTATAAKEDGWYTQAQIAHLENVPVEAAADLVKQLKSKPSRHAHLKNDKAWQEYYYVGNQRFGAERKNESSLTTASQVEVKDGDTMKALEQDLGAAALDFAEPPAKKPRRTVVTSPGSAKGSAENMSADPPAQEDAKDPPSLEKLETQFQTTVKAARELHKKASKLIDEKPHYQGWLL